MISTAMAGGDLSYVFAWQYVLYVWLKIASPFLCWIMNLTEKGEGQDITFEDRLKLQKEDGVVSGPGDDESRPVEEEKDILSNIIKALNDLYGVNLTEEDKVDMERLLRKLYADEELKATMTADNTLQNKKEKFDRVTDKHLTDYAHSRLGE